MTSDLAFVVAPLSRGGGEAEISWTQNYPTQGLPVSTTSVCLRFSVFLQSRPTIRCVRPSIVLSTLLLTYSCPASEEGEFECSDDCRKAAENYKEEVGCCVSYWQEGTGGSGDGESVADIFSACGVEMPDSCTEIHPPEEFLDCAHGDGGDVAGNGSAEMLVSVLQWNLRIKDKLVHGPLSTIRGLSFIGEFLSKSLFCVL